MLKRLLIIIIGVGTFLAAIAQEEPLHTTFVGLPLSLPADSLVQELKNRGLQQDDVYSLSGRITGMDIWLQLNCTGDSVPLINSLMLTTRHQQGPTLRDDYKQLMKWMRHHYGTPHWESTVRGHAFARWFVDYDHDIIMIATAQPSIEIWFYENHKKRNIDYYAILKHCERNPTGEVPHLTAQESVTWKNTAKATPAKQQAKHGKKKIVKRGKSTAKRSRKASKSRKRRR